MTAKDSKDSCGVRGEQRFYWELGWKPLILYFGKGSNALCLCPEDVKTQSSNVKTKLSKGRR